MKSEHRQLPVRIAPDRKPVVLNLKAAEANRLHAETISLARKSLTNAIVIGKLLTEAKDQLPHGQWLIWQRKNLTFTDRTARNYIRCFEERARLKMESLSTLTDAYRLLAEPKYPPVPPQREPLFPSQEKFNDGFETALLAASGCRRRGMKVTDAECLELALLLTFNHLRINADGQGEIFDGERWNQIDESEAA